MRDLIPRGGAPNEARKPTMLFLANLRESGRRTTQSALDACARILANASWRMMPWHEVRWEHVSALRAVLQARFAPATVNKHLVAVRGVLKACWQAGLLDGDSYAKAVSVKNVKASTLPRGRMLEVHELAALWKTADERGSRDGALLTLLFSAGLRRAEACALRWDHVAFRVDAGGAETCWLLVEGKGGKERRVPLRGTACCRMRRASELPEGNKMLSDYVLSVADPRSVAKMLERLVKAAGIEGCSCHDLRRSFVSHALKNGAELGAVSRMVGHASPRTTMRYDRRSDEALVEVADALPS